MRVPLRHASVVLYPLGLVLPLLLAGCTATYSQHVTSSPDPKFDRARTVVIATPGDGSFERKTYAGSGKTTALAVRAAFARFAGATSVSDACKDLACLRAIETAGAGYCVVPEILSWEDRATEWSGIPDRIEIRLSVYDRAGGQELSSVVLSGKSKWATFGGDHPQDLLDAPIRKYVQTLYP